VQLGGAHAPAVRHPDGERELHPPPGAPAVPAGMRDQLVESGVAERVVLHLADRPPARHAEPDRRPHDPRLGERRVDAAVDPEAVVEPGRDPEDAAGAPHVLAHHERAGVALELDVQRVV